MRCERRKRKMAVMMEREREMSERARYQRVAVTAHLFFVVNALFNLWTISSVLITTGSE